jgi:dimethylhistidine N-methyltransferase
MGLSAERQADFDGPLLDEEAERFLGDMLAGLSRSPKSLPPKWFYDAEGSRLFEDITRLSEYYPTRQEAALLAEVGPQVAEAVGPGAVVVEYGSGASEKTRILLDALDNPAVYVPLDISPEALADAARRIAAGYPELDVRPVVGDFEHLSPLPDGIGGENRLGFFPGSTLGNLEPKEAVSFMAAARRMLGAGAFFLLGVDLAKDEPTMVRAYDDSAGVTAAFNLNVLARANRDLGADFDLEGFRHAAVWNSEQSRMEMHLVATRDMTAHAGGRQVHFQNGETIHTESSRKFTRPAIERLARDSGWSLVSLHEGPAPSVALALLRA